MTLTNTAHPFGEYAIKPLVDDVLWIEHSDPGTVPAGMSTNGYAVLAGDEALIFDAPFDFLMAALGEIADGGHRPVGLILSHNHLVGTDDIGPAFQAAYDAPVMLHPLDADTSRVKRSGIRFEDPMTSPLLTRFGLEAILFPGQTAGSIMLYRARDGLLLTGDSAMGTTVAQSEQGIRHLVRAPWQTNADEDGLRRLWKEFDRPVQHIAPLHGTPQIGQSNLKQLMADLYRSETTGDLSGAVDGSGDV